MIVRLTSVQVNAVKRVAREFVEIYWDQQAGIGCLDSWDVEMPQPPHRAQRT